ncbi:MAG: transposase [Minicystis sp.]
MDTPEGARMREETRMTRRKRRAFTPEFKADAVRLAKAGDRTIAQVAKDLDLTETALREWVKRAEIDAGKGPADALTSAEREELVRLRRDVKRLEMEREILKNHHGRRPTSWTRNSSRLRATPGSEGAAGCFLEFSNPWKNMVQRALRT